MMKMGIWIGSLNLVIQILESELLRWTAHKLISANCFKF